MSVQYKVLDFPISKEVRVKFIGQPWWEARARFIGQPWWEARARFIGQPWWEVYRTALVGG